MVGKTAIIDFFLRKNIGNIFYLPGIHTLSLTESMIGKNINIFVPRHEASMAFMADGFARASGKVGVLIVTPGPGLGNVVTGCMEANSDDIPLLVVHFDTGREDIGKGILHELVEPESIFRHVTKQTFSVHGKEDLVNKLEQAHNTAITGRKGPVLISVPYTLLEKKVSPQGPFRVEPISPEPPHDFSELDRILANMKKPVIIGGKLLMLDQARPLLNDLCANSSIPFLTTTSGKGILDEDNSWCFGNIMQKGVVKEILSSADVTIAIGTRLRDVDAKRRGVKMRSLVHFDIDNHWFDKNYPASFKVSGEILPLLYYLKKTISKNKFEWSLKELKKRQQHERQHLFDKHPGFQLMSALRESAPDTITTVWDLNLISYWAEYYFSVCHQHSFIMPRGISPIFYALPAAIGAKIARPEKPCLAVCGDGSILPTMGELSTVRKYNIPIVTLVFNNNSFGILEDYMRATYSLEGTMDLENPDFMKISSAFGIKGKRVKSLPQLKKVFQESVTWDEPFLIEFSSPVFAPPWRA